MSTWEEDFRRDMDELAKRSKRRRIALGSIVWVWIACTAVAWFLEVTK